jgi:peptidoglycan/LPS O-acetylase OafA/YrhL
MGLFGMGVVAAHITANKPARAPYWRLLALLAAALALVAITRSGEGTPDSNLWPADLIVGTAIALMFVTSDGEKLTWTARFLSLRPIVILGTFSYSLYLVHGPLVALVGAALQRVNAGVTLSAIAWGATVVIVPALAYCFYLVAERPFLSAGFREAIEKSPDHERLYVPDGEAVNTSQSTA